MNEIGDWGITIISKSQEDIENIKKALEKCGLEFSIDIIREVYGIPVLQTLRIGKL